jgi:hypothetical protein
MASCFVGVTAGGCYMKLFGLISDVMLGLSKAGFRSEDVEEAWI